MGRALGLEGSGLDGRGLLPLPRSYPDCEGECSGDCGHPGAVVGEPREDWIPAYAGMTGDAGQWAPDRRCGCGVGGDRRARFRRSHG